MKEYKQMYKSECRYLNNDLKRMSRSKRKDEKAIIKDSWKEYFKKTTIDTGFNNVDKFNLFQTNSVSTIFGRPASGKTSFALNIVINLLKQDKHCIIFSLGESKQETECDLACIIANLDVNKIKTDKATAQEKEKYNESIEWLKTRKLEIYDGHFTSNDILNKVTKEPECLWFRTNKPDLVLIDYVSDIIPTRANNNIGFLHCIKNRSTSVIITTCSARKTPKKLKDKELIRLSDKIIRLKEVASCVTEKELEELEKQDRLDDIELSIIKNKEGEKGKITLKRKLLVFTEKENENNKINDKKLW